MPRYLAAADIMAMNDAIVSRVSSRTSVVRDAGALESAVMRPQMAAHYEAADLVAQAATLMAGITLARAFLDGNKRTAVAAGAAFLYLNGFMITVS
jgi:death on curing protein